MLVTLRALAWGWIVASHRAKAVSAANTAIWAANAKPTLVLTTYGHLMPQSEDRMRKAIDAAYAVSADSCAPTVPQRSAITP